VAVAIIEEGPLLLLGPFGVGGSQNAIHALAVGVAAGKQLSRGDEAGVFLASSEVTGNGASWHFPGRRITGKMGRGGKKLERGCVTPLFSDPGALHRHSRVMSGRPFRSQGMANIDQGGNVWVRVPIETTALGTEACRIPGGT